MSSSVTVLMLNANINCLCKLQSVFPSVRKTKLHTYANQTERQSSMLLSVGPKINLHNSIMNIHSMFLYKRNSSPSDTSVGSAKVKTWRPGKQRRSQVGNSCGTLAGDRAHGYLSTEHREVRPTM